MRRDLQRAGTSRLIRKHNRIANPNPTAGTHRCENADIGLMVLPCRAQNRRVMTQFGLRMDRHRTANRWSHPDDAHSGTNFEHTAEPTVLDKTVSLVAGI